MVEKWKGKHFSIFQDDVEISPGKVLKFEWVWRIDGTRTIVEDASGNILITREFRHELDGFDWRLPGGKLNSVDENIEIAASRELQEETGVIANKWQFLWTTTPDATVRFQRHFLHATDLIVGEQNLDDGEDIEVNWFSKNEIRKMAITGEIKEEISALALLRYIDGRR